MTPQEIADLIREEAKAQGLDPEIAVRVAEIESSLRPGVRNKKSSASGLFQLTALRRRELGLPMKDKSVHEEVRGGVYSLKQAQDYLKDRLERDPEGHEIYAAHFSGPSGSVKVLSAPEQRPLEQVYSRKALRANPELRGLTTGQLREQWRAKFGDLPSRQEAPAPAAEPVPQEFYPRQEPDWEAIGRSQLTAQAPGEAPVMMAGGGEVDERAGARISQLVQAARTEEDFRRINEMLGAMQSGQLLPAAGPRAADQLQMFAKGGSVSDPLTGAEGYEVPQDEGPAGERVEPKSAKELLKQIARESGSNVESLARGAVSMIPGTPGEAESFGRKALNWAFGPGGVKVPEQTHFPTAAQIRAPVPRVTEPTEQAAGMERLGEAMNVNAARQLAALPGVGKALLSEALVGSRPADQFFAGPAGMQRGAVRPPGGGVAALPETGASRDYNPRPISKMESWLGQGLTQAAHAPNNPEARDAMEEFWRTKAANYMTRQFGTPEDPIYKQIVSGTLTTPPLEKEFRKYAIEQASVGKTRVNPATGEERFYPKYPEAMEDLTRRYDQMTGIAPIAYSQRPNLLSESKEYFGTQGEAFANQKQNEIVDRLMAAGVRPELINVPPVNVITTNPAGKLVGSQYITSRAEPILTGAQLVGPKKGGHLESSGAIQRAIANEEPIYDIALQKPLTDILDPTYINEYLSTLSAKEIKKTRFEDVVKDSAKFHMKKFEWENLINDIRSGRRVNEKFFTEGVSAPLLQFQEGPHAGYAWKKLESSRATVPEGAYLGHSVGGYELGGPTYTSTKREAFKQDKMQVFSLRDNRNRPVTTVEVRMEGENTPVVTQVKGNGRATGNTAPASYGREVEEFFRNVLKPARIDEHDTYLTPNLQSYKALLEAKRSRKNTEQHLRGLYPDID